LQKKAAFAKYVNIIGQFFMRNNRQHIIYNAINISLVIFFVLQGITMGRQKSYLNTKPDFSLSFFITRSILNSPATVYL